MAKSISKQTKPNILQSLSSRKQPESEKFSAYKKSKNGSRIDGAGAKEKELRIITIATVTVLRFIGSGNFLGFGCSQVNNNYSVLVLVVFRNGFDHIEFLRG